MSAIDRAVTRYYHCIASLNEHDSLVFLSQLMSRPASMKFSGLETLTFAWIKPEERSKPCWIKVWMQTWACCYNMISCLKRWRKVCSIKIHLNAVSSFSIKAKRSRHFWSYSVNLQVPFLKGFRKHRFTFHLLTSLISVVTSMTPPQSREHLHIL